MGGSQQIVITRNCACCGEELRIEANETAGMNKDGHYFGTFRFGIGMWSKYEMKGLDVGGNMVLKRCVSRRREIWFRLIDLKRLLFGQFRDVEYWECNECFNKAVDVPQSNFMSFPLGPEGTTVSRKAWREEDK